MCPRNICSYHPTLPQLNCATYAHPMCFSDNNSFFVVPSSDELKILMKKHGGGYQHYYSKSKCTHIIATNLPDSKIKDLKLVNLIILYKNYLSLLIYKAACA